MSAVACYQRNGKTGNLEMLAFDMTAKTDNMQVTDKHRQGTGTGSPSCWVVISAKCTEITSICNFPQRFFLFILKIYLVPNTL